jgi:PAS domain S-box-containing protein
MQSLLPQLTNEHFCRAAFHDSFIAQMVMSRDNVIVEVNDQACRLFRCPREKLLGLSCADLTHPDDVIPDLDLLREFEEKHLQNWQIEKRYIRNDGDIIWATVSVTVTRSEEHPPMMLVQIQDITDQKLLEDERRRNTEDLEQFVYIASHDLREPLTTIAGFATLLKRRCINELAADGNHFIDQIIEGTKRMEQKIDDLLAFSHAGRATPPGNFPLGMAVDEARRSIVRKMEESKAVIQIVGELPIVQGDRSMIAQVFQNLFSNSIKYRSKDTTPHITVSAEPEDDHTWIVAVSDNGIGFDMSHKDRIFGVFQRLYTVEQYPGTGIGLAIAKKIVERHRGRIWPLSEPGHGSTFFFTLHAAD